VLTKSCIVQAEGGDLVSVRKSFRNHGWSLKKRNSEVLAGGGIKGNDDNLSYQVPGRRGA